MEDYPQQIEGTRDIQMEWINMITNKGFKREFNGNQIRVIIESYLKFFKKIFGTPPPKKNKNKNKKPYIFIFIMQSLSFSKKKIPSKN